MNLTPVAGSRPTWKTVGALNAASRDAWVAYALQRVPPGSRLLDAGAGEQRYRRHCGHLEYVSQDFAQYAPDSNSTGLHDASWDYGELDIVSDITRIPQPDRSFDAVLCTEVFEHIPNPIDAIREFSRLIRRGGQLIITAPFCSLTHQAPFHFATGFNRYFYEEHLAKFGFQIVEMTPNGNYFEYVAQELRRTRDVGRRYAKTRTSLIELPATFFLLRVLARRSRADGGSDELLVFGYHVRAIKR
jgi:ubiquinone/menaquinone biosynthesis C-methylase UbiE